MARQLKTWTALGLAAFGTASMVQAQGLAGERTAPPRPPG